MAQQSTVDGELWLGLFSIRATQQLVWGSSSSLFFSQKHVIVNEASYYKVTGFVNTKALL